MLESDHRHFIFEISVGRHLLKLFYDELRSFSSFFALNFDKKLAVESIKHCQRLFARMERLAKRNKATLISLWSPGRAISANIGRELRPLRLVW
jgi:hypothetical protein